MKTVSSVLLVLLIGGCDSTGAEFRPVATDVAPIQDLGTLVPATSEELGAFAAGLHAGELPASALYGQLGYPSDPAITGGATFNFTGTGGEVCVVLDPEAVYWTRALDTSTQSEPYLYDDNVRDDADVDLEVGLSAYYNGSPGVEIGSFDAIYTDDLGYDHEIKFSECVQSGYFGQDAHAGRATVEYCTVDTDQRAGVVFTVVAKTFSVPIDDSIANFAIGVFEGRCSGLELTTDECFFRDEYGEGEATGYFSGLEEAYCQPKPKELNAYCEGHFGDDPAPCNEHAN